MSKPAAKYQIHIVKTNKYAWDALLVDISGEKPDQTTLTAKSLVELMGKALVAVVLRDQNVGVLVEPADAPNDPLAAPPPIPGNGLATPHKLITPSKRIILGN